MNKKLIHWYIPRAVFVFVIAAVFSMVANAEILDNVPGASAAYSLRKLDSTYTGSAIRVRRSSDNVEQDIGFNNNGDLDSAALKTFVEGKNGFVTTWYDQSGNSKDFIQTTASAQPIIALAGEQGTSVGACEGCSLPDSAFTASSFYNGNYAPHEGRLNQDVVIWVAKRNNTNQWLQVDMGSILEVGKVATQGRTQHDQWVKSYKLQYSNDAVSWTNYNGGQTLSGNWDRNTIVRNDLSNFTARYIRFLPQTWESHISMRVDIYEPDGESIESTVYSRGMYFDGNDSLPNPSGFQITGAGGWSNFGVTRMEGTLNKRIFTANQNYLFGHWSGRWAYYLNDNSNTSSLYLGVVDTQVHQFSSILESDSKFRAHRDGTQVFYDSNGSNTGNFNPNIMNLLVERSKAFVAEWIWFNDDQSASRMAIEDSQTSYWINVNIPSQPDLNASDTGTGVVSPVTSFIKADISMQLADDVLAPVDTDIAKIKIIVSGDTDGADEKIILDGTTEESLNADFIKTNQTIGGVIGVNYSYINITKELSITKNNGTVFTRAQVKSIIEATRYKNTQVSATNDGVRAFTFTYINNGNRESENSTTSSITVDRVKPASFSIDVNISSGIDSPIITFSTTDNIGVNHYEVSIDNSTFTAQTSPYSPTLTAASSHKVKVRAYDAAGNYRESTVIYPPVINITAPTILSNQNITDTTFKITGVHNITTIKIIGTTSTNFTCGGEAIITGGGVHTFATSKPVPVSCSGGVISGTSTLKVEVSDGLTTGKTSKLYTIDTISPIMTISQDTSSSIVVSDNIAMSVSDSGGANLDISSIKYGFSGDAICNSTDNYSTAYTSGAIITVNTEVNNGKYICFVAKDSAGNTSYKRTTNSLNIDANEAPTINNQTFNIDENSANGISLGTVVAADIDTTVPNNTLRYSITGGNTNSVFNIDSVTGKLVVGDSQELDYETTTQYLLTVKVSDGGTPSMLDNANITVNINDLNDNITPPPTNNKRGGKSQKIEQIDKKTCKDSRAINFSNAGIHDLKLCIYFKEEETPTKDNIFSEKEKCSSTQTLTQNLKSGDRNNKYSNWEKGIITEGKILQEHMNRLGFKSGIVDGILGPITDGAIKRMQVYLGFKGEWIDGLVGIKTRNLINNSC